MQGFRQFPYNYWERLPSIIIVIHLGKSIVDQRRFKIPDGILRLQQAFVQAESVRCTNN